MRKYFKMDSIECFLLNKAKGIKEIRLISMAIQARKKELEETPKITENIKVVINIK